MRQPKFLIPVKLPHKQKKPNCFCWSPNGQFIVVGAKDHVFIFNAISGLRVCSGTETEGAPAGSEGILVCITWSRLLDKEFGFIACGRSKIVEGPGSDSLYIWKVRPVENGRLLTKSEPDTYNLSEPTNYVTCVAFSYHYKKKDIILASGTMDGHVRIWSYNDKTENEWICHHNIQFSWSPASRIKALQFRRDTSKPESDLYISTEKGVKRHIVNCSAP